MPRERTFTLGITGQGRVLGTLLVAGNASLLRAKLGRLGAKGRQRARQECAGIPQLFQGASPPPPASPHAKKAAEKDVVQLGGKLGDACVGRRINKGGRRLPGSQWRSYRGGMDAETGQHKTSLSLQTSEPKSF